MTRVTAKALGRSSFYVVVGQVWRIGSRIVLTPIIIASLGLEGYGIWILLFSICAYTGIVDQTFNAAYSKFTAEFDAKGQYDRLGETISSGVLLAGAAAALLLGLIWSFRSAAFASLGVPEAEFAAAGQALGILCLAVFLKMSLGYGLQVLAGLQRLDLRSKLRILGSAVEFCIALSLLYRGWGLVGLALGHLGGQLVVVATAWRLYRRLCPELRVSPRLATVAGARRIGSLGGRFQFLAFLQLLMTHGIKLLISGVLGVATLGLYELAFKLLQLGSAVGFALVGPLMPAFANLHASGMAEKYWAMFKLSSKLVTIVAFPCFAFIAIFADRLVFLWTGNEYPLASWTVRALAASSFIMMSTGVATASLRGRGTLRLEMAYAVVSAAILAALVAPFYWLWGYHGIVWAIAVRAVVGSVWFLVVFARQEGLKPLPYAWETMLRPMVFLAPAIVLTGVLEPWLHLPWSLASARMSDLLDISAWGAAFVLIVAASAWFGALSNGERVDFIRKFRSVAAPSAVVEPPTAAT